MRSGMKMRIALLAVALAAALALVWAYLRDDSRTLHRLPPVPQPSRHKPPNISTRDRSVRTSRA